MWGEGRPVPFCYQGSYQLHALIAPKSGVASQRHNGSPCGWCRWVVVGKAALIPFGAAVGLCGYRTGSSEVGLCRAGTQGHVLQHSPNAVRLWLWQHPKAPPEVTLSKGFNIPSLCLLKIGATINENRGRGWANVGMHVCMCAVLFTCPCLLTSYSWGMVSITGLTYKGLKARCISFSLWIYFIIDNENSFSLKQYDYFRGWKIAKCRWVGSVKRKPDYVVYFVMVCF